MSLSSGSLERLLGVDFDIDIPISLEVETSSTSKRTTTKPGKKYTSISEEFI